MSEDDGGEGGRTQIDKGGVEAEDGGVAELEQGAEQGGQEARVRVRQAVLVQMMNVRDAEVERRQEDDVARGQQGEEVQRDDGGAEDDFFGDGALQE